MKYICRICRYIYDEEIEKIKFNDLPNDWVYSLCSVSKLDFKLE